MEREIRIIAVDGGHYLITDDETFRVETNKEWVASFVRGEIHKSERNGFPRPYVRSIRSEIPLKPCDSFQMSLPLDITNEIK